MRTALLTLQALVAFAANSILCRLALVGGTIDAVSFAMLRLASGAVALHLVLLGRRERPGGNWSSVLALPAYVVPFGTRRSAA
jgi:hypothetical protein